MSNVAVDSDLQPFRTREYFELTSVSVPFDGDKFVELKLKLSDGTGEFYKRVSVLEGKLFHVGDRFSSKLTKIE